MKREPFAFGNLSGDRFYLDDISCSGAKCTLNRFLFLNSQSVLPLAWAART